MSLSPKKSHKVNSLIHKGHRLHQQGNTIKAALEFTKVLKIHTDNFDALQSLGAIRLQQKNYPEAIRYLTKASSVKTNIPGLQCNLGLAYQHTNNHDSATACYLKAIEIDSGFGEAYFNLALCQISTTRYHKALLTLGDSERCRPGHLGTLEQTGHVLNRLSRHGEAIKYFNHALQVEPENTALLFSLGKTLQSNRQYLEAVSIYEKILRLKEFFHEVRAKLADLLESINRPDEAQQYAEDILRDCPTHDLANLVLAKIERRNKEFLRAKERLGKLEVKDISDIDAAIQTELGLILDRLGEHSTAYDAFKKANNIMAELPVATSINQQSAFTMIDDHLNWLSDSEDTTHNSDESGDDYPSPTFLVGFPRSGTTLTEQILAANPLVVTADELMTLHDMASSLSEILGHKFKYPADLDTLNYQEVHVLRQYYWESTRVSLEGVIPDGHFIDKMPLNLIHLGLIGKIFPQSKIIVALRDPRDVCLSCFMQLFQLNESMIHFLNMDGTSTYYAAAMGLWLKYREKTQLNWIESRYEDIVADIEASTKKIMDFLELDATGNTKIFHQQASKRIVSTPSYQDVGTPIYQRAMGRWKNYQDFIQKPLQTLTPYVQAFGYAPTDEN